MDVCFLINQLAPGGAPTLLLDIVANTDADTDIDYTVCFVEGEDTLSVDFEDAGARVLDFGGAFKFDPRALSRMARFFRREEYDILHTHLPYSQTLGRIFGRLGGIETIVSTQHSIAEHYHPLTGTLERLTRPLDTKTIAISEGVERSFTGSARQYEPGQPDQWCTIYNGVDVAGFNERVRTADTTALESQYGVDDEPTFLTVGRYVPAKSQADLVTAMTRVVDTHPDARLFIIGWGDLEDDLRAAASDRGLSANITVTGRVSPTDIHEYYALADAFVTSSTVEGLGIAGLEAMAAELPVVATAVPGLREIVTEGKTGLLVPPNAPDQLADAMMRVLRTDKLYGTNGYERAAATFDIRKTVASYHELYGELCSDVNPPMTARHD
ncbi:glycosyltransferase [Halococcus salifodinae]|uniref:Glycosyltransferase n=1 Tax=Halococcus salifodinae DSM 8989 TaxID=1227456 RepID=M0N2J3_9EURY|nr:glycosyltransferase [Halococcus salifodinae]EMA52071.1 glycosyltransferase [Halococcus salifodinae DSM 8989]